MKFDDDIPILTEVLRTRTGRMHRPDPRPAAAPVEDGEAVELLPLDLVIGNDIRAAIEPYTTTDFGANDADAAPALIEPLEADHKPVPLSAEFDAVVSADEAPAANDYLATAASNEAERGALLASEDAQGLVEHAVAKQAAESVSVEAGASIEVPEATEGDQALVDASLVPDLESEPPIDPEALASRVQDAVLQDLAGRIDTELDARIAQALRFELEVALASLQGGLREQLSASLRDVVQRAVNDEITRLKSEGPR